MISKRTVAKQQREEEGLQPKSNLNSKSNTMNKTLYDETLQSIIERLTAIENKLDMIYKPLSSQVKQNTGSNLLDLLADQRAQLKLSKILNKDIF